LSENVFQASISSSPFGHTDSGAAVELYRLQNRSGMEARIATYGGIVTSLTAPDRNGHYADVVLGFDSLAGYLESNHYFGALIGRYANRIARGAFSLNGTHYTLPRNNGINSLHGGSVGFDKVVWSAVGADVTVQGPRLRLAYTSVHGEQGYPGTLKVIATYTLGDDNSLRLDCSATTDLDTIVCLTQHSYFNLRGYGDVLESVLQINARQYTPIDATQIPTGEFRSVADTPFDFRTPIAIGKHIDADDEQLRFGQGYDHNWIIDKPPGVLGIIAKLFEPWTGRVLEVSSTAPGMQFYSGNVLDGIIIGKGGCAYARRSAIALEPQTFPDSPNRPNFPSPVLKPGQEYTSTIVFRFLEQ
jgi:aldose 1-epimerase